MQEHVSSWSACNVAVETSVVDITSASGAMAAKQAENQQAAADHIASAIKENEQILESGNTIGAV